MAKKKDQFDFSAFVAEMSKKPAPKLQLDSKDELKYFLIVSEGERTEPIYFNYLASQLPKHMVNTIEVDGAGDNTLNVVNKAIELRDERKANKLKPNFDEVWAVYDKDDFPDARYNLAVETAGQNGIESAHSNQSFELWYVLHFQYLQSALHRDDYYPILSGHLGLKYAKNTLDVVKRIESLGNEKQAIAWAKALEEMHVGQSQAKSCPSTRVYELVERLRKYIDQTKNNKDL
ncbi:RloB family protein [Pedobacter aquatilis]|uniref:RloB family protein n=1 Tax=Pedobacter aquatilis TaxID=351343 RepID=UPI0025B62A5B|nr:RloB family protein [Pedobacter aquatilis]MDN3587173.1 RloB family protein [Pedobacter aquatilis]